MKQEQKNDLTSLWNQVPYITLEKYEESKVKFLEETKNLEFISSMLFYIEDEKLHNESILYDRKYFDEINSPFINPSIENRLTKEYVMELKRKYGIEKTNKMEQSAVEWLITKLNLFNITKEEHYEILCQIELEAKEMEKKQQGYSEEEVLVLLHKRDKHSMDKSLTFSSWQTPKEWFEQFKKKDHQNKYNEKEVILLLQKALTHKDDGEIGSLVTAQGEIRTANFFSWFEQFKNK